MRYEYWKSEDGLWYWQLRAGNDSVLARGQGYPSKVDVLHIINVVKNSGDVDVVKVNLALVPGVEHTDSIQLDFGAD